MTWETTKDAPLVKAVPISESEAQKLKFKFAPPEDVLVLGSYLLRTVAKPVLNIDVGIELPKVPLHSRHTLPPVKARLETDEPCVCDLRFFRVSCAKRRMCSTTATLISVPPTFTCWPRSCRRTSALLKSSGPVSGKPCYCSRLEVTGEVLTPAALAVHSTQG